MKYVIVIEETSEGYSASSPALAGCVATGITLKEVVELMKEAIEFHVDEICGEDGKL